MSTDQIIARFCGEALAAGVPAAKVLEAERRLRSLARLGQAVEVELLGRSVYLPRSADAPPRGRLQRA